MPDRQPGDERPQQLALARAGGPGHECVGTVADQVDLHRAVGGHRQPRAQRRVAARGLPAATHLVGIRGAAAREQRRQGHGGRQPGAGRRLLGVVPSGEREGHGPSRRRRRARRDDVVAQLGSAGPVEDGRAVGSCLDDDVADAGERRGCVREDQSGAGPVGGEQLADRRAASGQQRRIVHDEHHVRPAPSTRLRPADERLGKVGARRHQPVTGLGIAGVGQPAQPAPFRRARRGHGGHQEVGRAVGDGQLQDQAPRQRSGDRGWPDHAHDRAGAEVDGDRHVVERSRRLDERPPLVGHRVAARLQRRRLPAVTAAHDGGERTRLVGPARPERRTRRSGARHGGRELQCLGPQARRDGRLVGREIGGDGRERGARPLAVGPPPRPSTQPRPQRGGQRAQRADRAEDEERRLVQQQRDDGAAGEGHDDRRAGR